jgi:hypothetical protein
MYFLERIEHVWKTRAANLRANSVASANVVRNCFVMNGLLAKGDKPCTAFCSRKRDKTCTITGLCRELITSL